jgi:hypothetical protein
LNRLDPILEFNIRAPDCASSCREVLADDHRAANEPAGNAYWELVTINFERRQSVRCAFSKKRDREPHHQEKSLSQLCSDRAGTARERMRAEMRVRRSRRYGFVRFWAGDIREPLKLGDFRHRQNAPMKLRAEF